MAAERPKRRVVQPCLEYNGGLLHKEELQLRRALYASLVESKKPQGNSKHSNRSSATTGESTCMDDVSLNTPLKDVESNERGVEVDSDHHSKYKQSEKQSSSVSTQLGFEVQKDGQSSSLHHNNSHFKTFKTRPNKLNIEQTYLPAPSSNGDVSVGSMYSVDQKPGTSKEGGIKKRRRRRRRRITLKESTVDKGIDSSTLTSGAKMIPRGTLKVVKKRKRRPQGKGAGDATLDSVQLQIPAKKPKKEDKRIRKHVRAQRKFASSHPFDPSSLKLQQESAQLPTTRAKTENFLDFLCLRGQPFLPKELELFNTPCAPMSPLSSEDEQSSTSPSPSQSTAPSPAPSSLLENQPKSSGSPDLSSVDSPATSEAPMWESGVMRMYASGPKGRVRKDTQQRQRSDISPNISSDDVEEPFKAVTPPLAFRVSPRPTPLRSGSQKQNLPRPIPGPLTTSTPFITITNDSERQSIGSDSSLPPPPALITSCVRGTADSNPNEKSCCTPPPLLYIPAAAQRVTHLHGPPELKRFPPTTGGASGLPERKNKSEVELAEKSRLNAAEDPPLLTKYTAIRADHKRDSLSASSKTSPPLLQKFPSCSNKEISNEDFIPQHGIVARSDDGIPQLSKFGKLERHQVPPVAWRSAAEGNLPNLNRHPSRTDQEQRRSFLSRQNENPPTLERFSSVSHKRKSQNPTLLRGLGNQPTVLLDKLDRPFPLLQKEHSALSGGRQEIRPLTSDRECLTALTGTERSGSKQVCGSSAGKDTTVEGMRFAQSNLRVQPGPQGFQPDKNKRLRETAHYSSVKSNCVAFHSDSALNTPTTSSRPHSQPGVSFSSVVAFASMRRPQVTSMYTGKMTTETKMTSRTHVAPYVAEVSGKSQFAPQNVDLRLGNSSSSGWSAEFTKLHSVSLPSGQSSNVLPPPWSHLQPSCSSQRTSIESPRPYTLSVTVANSHLKPLFSSTNNSPARVELDSSNPVSPLRAVSVIRSMDSRSVAAPGDFLIPGIEEELASTARGEGPSCELYNRGRVRSRAVPVPASLPEAFQSPLLISGQLARNVDLSVILSSETKTEFISERGKVSGRSVMATTEMPLKSPNTKATKSEAIIAPVRKRRCRLVGRRAKCTLNESLPNEQVAHVNNTRVSVSTCTSSKFKTPKMQLSEKGVLKKTKAVGDNIDVSRESQEESGLFVFHPSEEEFKDPVSYIESIRSQAERFGLCVVAPPESWKPEFQISENLRFSSQCQLVHRLKERWGPVERKLACIRKHLEQQSISLTPLPQIGGYELDLPQVSKVVAQFGGMQKVIDNNKWNRVAELLRIPRAAQERIGKLEDAYCKYLLSYDLLPKEEKEELDTQVLQEREARETQGTVLESDAAVVKGRNLSLISFQRFARNILARLFKGIPSLDEVEKEFWNLVHNRDHYVSVFNGVGSTGQHGSCFPSSKSNPISKSGWNLNVLPRLPGSLLRHLGSVQDITVPWLQIDMVFSANTWQTHPLALNTIDYLHTGSDRIWYCVPPVENAKFVSVMESLQSRDDGADDPHVPMISPDTLRQHGLTVTRVVQKQGQFVVVFPKTFFSNLASGYAISEAVSFAPTEWLAYGPPMWQDLRDDPDWSEFAYEKLLLGLAEEDIENEDKDVVGCLLEELKALREAEDSALKTLFALGLSGTESIGRKHSLADEGNQALDSPWSLSDAVLYCEECNKPCCVSAVMNETGPVVLCLKHAAVVLKKEMSVKDFKILSRYDVARIDALISKVQGKLESLKRDGRPSQTRLGDETGKV